MAQPTAVRGHDRDYRAIIHRSARTRSETDKQGFALAMIYVAERAFACTEALSKGREEKIVAVLDYSDYVSAFAPSMEITKHAIMLLQKNYPERAKKIVILDPPFWMRSLFTIISYFLASETREKVSW
jgi:hypothetical protein